MARLLPRPLAKTTEEELSARVAKLKEKTGKTPILATILVGDDPASATYVKMKGNACARVGMESIRVVMDKNTTTEELLNKIQQRKPERAWHPLATPGSAPHR